MGENWEIVTCSEVRSKFRFSKLLTWNPFNVWQSLKQLYFPHYRKTQSANWITIYLHFSFFQDIIEDKASSGTNVVVVVDKSVNGRPKVYAENCAQESLIKKNETYIWKKEHHLSIPTRSSYTPRTKMAFDVYCISNNVN